MVSNLINRLALTLIFPAVGGILISCQSNTSRHQIVDSSHLESSRPPLTSNLPIPEWGTTTLLDKALEAKQNNDAYPQVIKYVQTSNQKLHYSANVSSSIIYLVMMKCRFNLTSQLRPPGAKAPTGDSLNFTVNEKNGQRKSIGMNNLPSSLNQLGQIESGRNAAICNLKGIFAVCTGQRAGRSFEGLEAPSTVSRRGVELLLYLRFVAG